MTDTNTGPAFDGDSMSPIGEHRNGRMRIIAVTGWADPVRIPRLPISVLIAIVFVFAALTVNVVAGYGMSTIDQPLLTWAIDQRSAPVTAAMVAISSAGGGLTMTVAALIGAAILVRYGHRWPAGLVVIAAIGAAPLTTWSKQLIGRERPPATDHLVLETNQSFPSGHSLGSLAVVGVLAIVLGSRLHNRKARVAAAVIAAIFVVAVGVSRLYLGVHWPTDIVGGWLLGTLWLGICLLGYRILTDRCCQRAADTAASTETAA